MTPRLGPRRSRALQLHRKLITVWSAPPGWRGWLVTTNNNDIGLLFLGVATAFFVIGGLLAMLIRIQLATPRSAFMAAETYSQIFTMHGTVMMFLFAIPFFEALSILLLPGMLGTRDMAFPRLGAFGVWVYIFGGSAVIVAMIMGLAPDGGWFMYPPLSSTAFSPGIGADVWLLGITSIEVSAIAAAVEVVVTVLRYRAAGMSLARMPIFAWYMLVVALMILTAFPPMILGSVLLEVERALGWPFYRVEEGGDPLLWQHLFWLFGHPEVYIIFLPAAGMIGTILPVMARTQILGYGWVVAAAISLAVLSFGLWVHHMFATGIPQLGLAFFSAASTLVAVPTAVMVFAWIGTLWQGRPVMHLPMLWILGFFATFVIGGLTGVMLAIVPFDWQVHDTHFIVAHLHYVLIGGYVFPMIAAVYYFLPLLTGRHPQFRLGRIAFWVTVPAFHLTFLAMHWAGLLGQRRRIATYEAEQGWEAINFSASIGAFALAIGFALVILDLGLNAVLAPRSRRNPWAAGTLEWAVPLPSPVYGFGAIPVIEGRAPLDMDPALPHRIARGEGYLAGADRHRRETLIVDTATGAPAQVAVLPGNSILPFLLAIVTSLSFLAPLFGAHLVSALALVGVAGLAVFWAWTSGRKVDEGPVDAGLGQILPTSHEVPDPPGWWGSLLLLLADGVHFGSLLFGYAFLWTIAPNWPPPSWITPGLVGPILAGGGGLALMFGPRRTVRAISRSQPPRTGLALTGVGVLALAAAAGWMLRNGPDPTSHAFGATVWLLAGHVLLHAVITLIMLGFLALRIWRGYTSPRRNGEARILQLWADFTAVTGLLALTAAWAPGAFA
ncbi:cytochrome ubiquinol oxidase subunit I [Gemmobacter lanyuensis]|uniref:Cytochrome ubiquinol oxidase subunit I n=2 Tax=Gemmobacter lanyuensis TaxID=1054497 RepID=A0A918MKC6_9RHOB|nr:cbb3-type cytochrome c oxidase subunit I [Gemmobacter lanyuensis]GGW34564.1 cytochrome ubiquinol oxidase subunit I [Gemmobacter lanyuensis]